MSLSFFQFLLGSLLLYYGAEFLIKGSKTIANKFNIERLQEYVNNGSFLWPGAKSIIKKKGNIKDLHFHDLRHEATSCMFEKGLNIMEVASITGHKDVRMLYRYTHPRAELLAQKLL